MDDPCEGWGSLCTHVHTHTHTHTRTHEHTRIHTRIHMIEHSLIHSRAVSPTQYHCSFRCLILLKINVLYPPGGPCSPSQCTGSPPQDRGQTRRVWSGVLGVLSKCSYPRRHPSRPSSPCICRRRQEEVMQGRGEVRCEKSYRGERKRSGGK